MKIFTVAAVVTQAPGCKDTVSPAPQPAAMTISVQVTGLYPFAGFEIHVDDRPLILRISDGSLVVRGLSAGTHTVSLVGVAANCKIDGRNPATVEASPGSSSAVEFHVTCVFVKGAIAVNVAVSGIDRPLWLTAGVDEYYGGPVWGSGTTVLADSFPGGAHVVQLSGIPRYCEPSGALADSVNVVTGAIARDTAVANFRIHCTPPELGSDPEAAIAFERDGYIMVMRESGGAPVALAEGEEPAWSPDAKLMSFRRMKCRQYVDDDDRIYRICEHDLWIMSPAGDNQRPVSTDENTDDTDGAISPNGESIAYTRFRLGPDMSDVALSDLKGGSISLLTIGLPADHPAWSPDGEQIAIACGNGDHVDLCVFSTARACTNYYQCSLWSMAGATPEVGNRSDPAWSPDGRRIAMTFACTTSATPSGGACAPGITPAEPLIAVVDLSTLEVTRLTAGHDPSWSPDGSRLVFVGNASSPGLRVYSFADGSVRQLTTNPLDASPSWRR